MAQTHNLTDPGTSVLTERMEEKRRNEENRRVQREMQRVRANARPDPERLFPRFPNRREDYEEGLLFLSTGWKPDPDRRVSSHWVETYLDKRGQLSLDESGLYLANGEEVMEDPAAPLKVRWLRGPKQGAVEELDTLAYVLARGSTHDTPNCEPVPSDEPLGAPARPANMPSSLAKAWAIVGKALKKEPAETTFEEMVKFFSERPTPLLKYDTVK